MELTLHFLEEKFVIELGTPTVTALKTSVSAAVPDLVGTDAFDVKTAAGSLVTTDEQAAGLTAGDVLEVVPTKKTMAIITLKRRNVEMTRESWLQAGLDKDQALSEAVLDAGLPVNEHRQFGTTLLMDACKMGTQIFVEQLLERGASLEARNDEGETSLLQAVLYQHPDIVDLLLGSGADVNGATNGGNTPLMCAVKHDMTEICGILLAHAADVSLKNATGETAMGIAREHDNQDLITVLQPYLKD